MKTTILLTTLLLIQLTCYAQFNPPWYNDPGGVPETYWTDNGGQYRHQTYYSNLHGLDIGYWIYLPPSYMADSTVEHSIFYWLHGGATGGLNENANSWVSDDYIEEHPTYYEQVRNSIVVYPNGLDMEFWTDHYDQLNQIESTLIWELISHISINYNVAGSRDCHGVIGHSMGGYGAIKYLFKYPDYFSQAVSIDGSIFPSLNHDPAFVSDPAYWFYYSVFQSESYLNANSVYTWVDDYYLNNSPFPVSLMILAGESDPLEGYQASKFVNYLDSVYNFNTTFILNPSMGHDVTNFLNAYGDDIYSFQNANLCGSSAVGLEEPSVETGVNVYPNPSNGSFNVGMNGKEMDWIKIYDQRGKCVWNASTLPVESLSNGVYVIELSFEQSIVRKKLVVQE